MRTNEVSWSSSRASVHKYKGPVDTDVVAEVVEYLHADWRCNISFHRTRVDAGGCSAFTLALAKPRVRMAMKNCSALGRSGH
ncbi:MAG: hypothetical protein M2R45_03351 [Verrucomicrobia subdivision 3 bacterium]|nr:hypothetical protein [Limisphaerales bacterium]MCS1416735.1 hypothetical protein [Limisphaerales bacterium]